MLNRPKLLKELSQVSGELFTDQTPAYDFAWKLWQQLCDDSVAGQKIRAIPQTVSWQGELNKIYPIAPLAEYAVLAVDGSQIYPDRHQSARCFLINIGSIYIRYGNDAHIVLASEPTVGASNDEEFGFDQSADIVNCLREEQELRAGLQEGIKYRAQSQLPLVVLFDGSLIFWHLDAKDQASRERFLSSYLGTFAQFERAQLLMASYISFPKSKELIQLLRLFHGQNKPTNGAASLLDHLVDSYLVSRYVPVGYRTTIFENRAPITDHYPQSLRPHFFYLNTGNEIARVEVPAWIAHNNELLEQVASLILDQATKGRGYPITLAEAHEQAVVKGPDREFFYHVVQKLGIEQNQRHNISRKSLHKRSVGI
jgi:hypothetical protein